MNKYIVHVVFLICLCSLQQSEASLFGNFFSNLMPKCANVTTVQNFNITKYTGLWYEIQRRTGIPTAYEAFLRCITAEYAVKDSRNVQVKNGGKILTTNIPYSQIGNAYIINPNEPSKLLVTFNSFFSSISTPNTNGNYWVLDTDYTSYSLVYSCSKNLLGIPTEVAWILGRNRTFDSNTLNRLLTTIRNFSPSLASAMKPTDQSNC